MRVEEFRGAYYFVGVYWELSSCTCERWNLYRLWTLFGTLDVLLELFVIGWTVEYYSRLFLRWFWNFSCCCGLYQIKDNFIFYDIGVLDIVGWEFIIIIIQSQWEVLIIRRHNLVPWPGSNHCCLYRYVAIFITILVIISRPENFRESAVLRNFVRDKYSRVTSIFNKYLCDNHGEFAETRARKGQEAEFIAA